VGGVVTHRWRHGELRSLSEGVPFLALPNPGLEGTPRTTPTLACAVTYLPPGLHSLPAPGSTGVRVLLEGEVGFTPAAGAAFRLSARDVVRTGDIGPGEWEPGESGAFWLDAVDMPLVSALSSGDGMRPRRPGPGPCAFAEGADCRTPTRVHRWAQTRTVLEQADPTRRLPTGVAVRCVHSPTDERVPFAQSARFVDAARRAGDDAELIEVRGVHVDGIDVRTRAGQRVVSVLEGMTA
jgi:hypothetical protein